MRGLVHLFIPKPNKQMLSDIFNYIYIIILLYKSQRTERNGKRENHFLQIQRIYYYIFKDFVYGTKFNNGVENGHYLRYGKYKVKSEI